MLMPWTVAPAVSQRGCRTPAVWASSPSAGRHTALVALASAVFFWSIWGEGNLQASLGMHDPKPMKYKTSSRIQDCPKNSVILATAMTQSGVLGKR